MGEERGGKRVIVDVKDDFCGGGQESGGGGGGGGVGVGWERSSAEEGKRSEGERHRVKAEKHFNGE